MMIRVMLCGRCRHVLDVRTDASGVGYQHAQQDSPADHEPEPTPAPEGYQGRCDFCNVDHPEFVLPVRDFRLPGLQNHMSHGAWAACRTCGTLLKGNRWTDLVTRIVALKESRECITVSPAVRTRIAALYRVLRKNITGALHPISTAGGTSETEEE